MKRKLKVERFNTFQDLADFAENNMLWVNDLLVNVFREEYTNPWTLIYWQMVKEEENAI